jgi:hypothetical protein
MNGTKATLRVTLKDRSTKEYEVLWDDLYVFWDDQYVSGEDPTEAIYFSDTFDWSNNPPCEVDVIVKEGDLTWHTRTHFEVACEFYTRRSLEELKLAHPTGMAI